MMAFGTLKLAFQIFWFSAIKPRGTRVESIVAICFKKSAAKYFYRAMNMFL